MWKCFEILRDKTAGVHGLNGAHERFRRKIGQKVQRQLWNKQWALSDTLSWKIWRNSWLKENVPIETEAGYGRDKEKKWNQVEIVKR